MQISKEFAMNHWKYFELLGTDLDPETSVKKGNE